MPQSCTVNKRQTTEEKQTEGSSNYFGKRLNKSSPYIALSSANDVKTSLPTLPEITSAIKKGKTPGVANELSPSLALEHEWSATHTVISVKKATWPRKCSKGL